jgi:hypothetical protein
MEITLSEEQYENLVRMMYLGNWMIISIRTPDEEIKKYDELEQHIYSFAKGTQMERYITFDNKINKFITNWEADEHPEVDHYIDEYDEENFWHMLVHMLAERDFIRTYGEEKIEAMPFEERIEKEGPFIEKYSNEFSQNGLENVKMGI